MRETLLVIIIFIAFGCSERGAEIVVQKGSPNGQASSPTPEDERIVIPVIPTEPLNLQNQKELNATLPLTVREILEKADTLEVLGLSSEDKAGTGWYPDVKAKMSLGAERSELLKSFFFDASAGPNTSACFIPRHSLKASYRGKTVEVVICFQCHLFIVKGDVGKFNGGLYRDGSAAHHLFNDIIRTKGEPIK